MEKVRLEDVCEILDSKRIPIKEADRKIGPYPYYGANGIQGYVDNYIFDDNLVLLAEDGGNFGSKEKPIAYKVTGKCWINNHAHVLKPLNTINVDYLCYSLMFYDVRKLVNGATRQKLTQSDMRKMKIPLLPLPEQNKIVNILNTTSQSINNYKEQLNQLDLLIKARFVEMFGNPIANDKKWNLKTLNEVGSIGRGVSKHRPRNAPELLGGNYPLIQTGDIANSELFLQEYHQTYSDIGLKQSKLWKKGTLCITIAANIAKTAILSFDACFPDSIVGFTANSYINNIFVHYWFSFFQQILESQAPASAQKNINLEILRKLKIIVPPIDLQNKFTTFVELIDKSKVIVQKSLKETQILYDSLMQRYFN